LIRTIVRAFYRATVLLMLCGAAASPSWGGDSLDLQRYPGKIVIVDFWASWCAPCRQSFPWLNEMQLKYADQGLIVVGVNVDRVRADADRFLREVPAKFGIVYDPEGAIATRYDLPGMPTSLVFGRNGELIGTHVGFRSAVRDEREAELRKLLATASDSK